MKKYVWLVFLALPTLLLSGCVSYHVANYQADQASAKAFQSKVKTQVGVAAFTMKADQNSNAVLCRAAGKVYLPNKQTYTQYIQSAFVSQLKAADRYASAGAKHTISGRLTKVDFSSTSGDWIISGQVRVDQHAPVSIHTVTNFKTSLVIAYAACHDVAKAFAVASQHFVKKSLSNPTILRELKA